MISINNLKGRFFMNDISVPQLKMNDGNVIPALGFGTYKLNGSALRGLQKRILNLVSMWTRNYLLKL
jgi:hypothetical protein